MPVRSAVLAAAIAAAGAFTAGIGWSAPASAQIYIGPGGPFAPGPPPPPYYGRPGYGGPYYGGPGYGGPSYGGRISCGEGAQIVAESGFRRISARECQGRVYRYTAYRGQTAFEVRVASANGEITQIRRIQ
jgi:hypothetical protein